MSEKTKSRAAASGGKAAGNKSSSGRRRGSAAAAGSGKRKTTAAGKSSAKGRGAAAASSSNRTRSAASGTKAKQGGVSEKNRKVEEYRNPMVGPEVILWVLVALAALLFISFAGMGGSFGKAVRDLFFGTFGILAYLFPIFVFGLAVYLTVTHRSRQAVRRTICLVVLFLIACGLLQLALLGYSKNTPLMDYYTACAYYRTGGGLAGGLLVSVLCPLFGTVGACIILGIAAMICIVLVFEFTLIAPFGEASGRAARRHMQEVRERRAMEAQREQYIEDTPRVYLPDAEETDSDHVSLTDLFVPEKGRRRNGSSGQGTSAVSETGSDAAAAAQKPSVFTLSPGPQTAVPAPSVIPRPQVQPAADSQTGSREESEIPVFTITREEEGETGWEDPAFEEEEDISPSELLRRAGQPSARESKAAQDGGSTGGTEGKREAGSRGEDAQASAKHKKASEEEIQEGIQDVEEEISETAAQPPVYVYPPLTLLSEASGHRGGPGTEELRSTALQLQQVLETFGVKARVTNVSCGPSVTRYELLPEMGVRVSKIVGLTNDIKLSLAASDIRIEAPIPGKSAVGIEVPNKETSKVLLRELLESEAFLSHPSRLAYVVGKDIGGKIIVSDIARMPHLLIAGATGSGKSVFINTLIMSILYHSSPEDVRMIMIDPKVVELSVYNGIPHLLIPVVTDPKKAAGALNWGVAEMMKRYDLFAKAGVRDLKGYNAKVAEMEEEYRAAVEAGEQAVRPVKLPQIVIIVDELADLMMVAAGDVEDAIVRLTQLARAAGVHLVIATQRPSVDVITGLIKANIPSRIAFSVSSAVDSRTILDMGGAEKLLGNGDMLFSPQNFKVPARVQGAFISDEEVADVVSFLKESNHDEQYEARMEKQLAEVQKSAASSAAGGGSDTDELFADAGRLLIEKDKASIGMLQRAFKIGFNRAARIMEQLSDAGVVGPEEGTKPRKLLMSMEEFENYLEQH